MVYLLIRESVLALDATRQTMRGGPPLLCGCPIFNEQLDGPGQFLLQYAIPGRHVGDADDDLAVTHRLGEIGIVIALAPGLEIRIGHPAAGTVEVAQVGRRGDGDARCGYLPTNDH